MRFPLLVAVAAAMHAAPALAQQDGDARQARLDWYVASACDVLGHDSALAEAGPAMMARMAGLGTAVDGPEMDAVAAELARQHEASRWAAMLYCREKADEARASYASGSAAQ